MYYQRNIEVRSSNHCCRGKAISIIYSERVFVALDIQYAKRTRRIILSSVAYLYLQISSTLSHKRHDFSEKVIEHKLCVLILTTNTVYNISHYKKN
jgi:hypothetical protein